MCDSGKGETFCKRSKKEQSARKISRCARNDGIGGSKSPRNVGWRQAVLSVFHTALKKANPPINPANKDLLC